MTASTQTTSTPLPALLSTTSLINRYTKPLSGSSCTKAQAPTATQTPSTSSAVNSLSPTLDHTTEPRSTSNTILRNGSRQPLPYYANLENQTTPSPKPFAPSPSSTPLPKSSPQSYLRTSSTWLKPTTSSQTTILEDDQAVKPQTPSCSQYTGPSKSGENASSYQDSFSTYQAPS